MSDTRVFQIDTATLKNEGGLIATLTTLAAEAFRLGTIGDRVICIDVHRDGVSVEFFPKPIATGAACSGVYTFEYTVREPRSGALPDGEG